MSKAKKSDEVNVGPRKRGRPRKHGVQPGTFLVRGCFALAAFDCARSSGEKYEAALEIAAKSQNISVREVKRVLARFRPKGASIALVTYGFTGIDKEEVRRRKEMGLERVFWDNPKILLAGIGEPPVHPRINARPQETTAKN